MSVFPVVKAYKLRATKINNCGLPQEGEKNRIVTDGFVTLNMTSVMNEAEELEQKNAEGKVCVSDRTPPTLKYYTPVLTLCNVNTELISMFTGWDQILDWNDLPIGFQDQEEVDGDYGVALELWTGGRADTDCPAPTLDSIFSTGSSGKSYGYVLIGGTEWQLGDMEFGAAVSTFTLTGRTVPIPQWGRGPYNVAGTDALGTPGRLLVPTNEKSQRYLFRTPVPPPELTNGDGTAAALDITGKFVDPDFYFGGPGNAPSADIAPDQDDSTTQTLAVTGGPTAGDLVVDVEYQDGSTDQVTIVFNSTAAQAKTALAALDDGFTASQWTTSGGPLPGTPIVITPPVGVSLGNITNNLTGGTTPTATIT